MIRPAQLADLEGLVALESRCFSGDYLTRRSFRHLLTRGNATTLVWDEDGVLLAYGLILFSRGTARARLYSIAVDERLRGRGVGRRLLAAAEEAALERGCVSMRSEVRRDNEASLALFQSSGYERFEVVEDYYEDHEEAIRFERILVPHLSLNQVRVPYYQQTTDFTCGPAALMMAMKALQPEQKLGRRLELRLWREATSIFMASGHGGCGPYGLALAGRARGFAVEVFVKERGVFLVGTVRDPDKKEVMRIVEEDFRDRIRQLHLPMHARAIRYEELRERFEAGAIPLVLISSWRIYEERFPHWVVITGLDSRFVYVHDPYVDADDGETAADSINMPIARKEFEGMSRYGRSGQRAVILISRPDA